jgi:pyridoxal phosphate-dependent aminotransferase EpsN
MKRIYLSPPHLDGQERQLLLDAFDSNWITTLGPHLEAFEREMCAHVGIAGAAALSSGTAGLHLALIMLGIQRGDEVFCSDLTFAATCYAVAYCNAKPVLIDCNADTWNMDLALLGEALEACKKRGRLPRAVIVVDLYGQAADYDPILELCSGYGVPVIEDAAEALGATYKGKPAGSFGEMGVFSFNGNKIVTTSGGGMLVSRNVDYITRAKHLASQARDQFPYYHHTSVGYNYRLSNLLAAIGRAQLQNLEKKVTRRREINAYYEAALGNIPGIDFMPEAPYGRSNRWLTCLTIDNAAIGVSNEDIRLYLEHQNIECRPVWKPMHMQPVFKECRIVGGMVSEDIFGRGLCLPSGSAMTQEDLDRVVSAIRSCIQTRSRLSS